MIEPYLNSIYRDGGRGEVVGGRRQYDCHGLARAVRHEVYGLPLMCSYSDIRSHNAREMTRACQQEVSTMAEGPPAPGALVTVWKRGLCTHVAVCVELDGRMGVLEANPHTGPRWQRVDVFEREYLTVVYYS